MLLPGGYYVIIIPDKRYCFDHFINETTIADVISMNINKAKNHSIKSVIEHRALTCHNDSVRHWNNDHGQQLFENDKNTIKRALNEYSIALQNDVYIDVHSLQFTPSSFSRIIDSLNKLEYIDLVVHKLYPTIRNSSEFFVILKKPVK
jgi:hypothetical protein